MNYIEKLIPYAILELIGFIIYIIRQLQNKERNLSPDLGDGC